MANKSRIGVKETRVGRRIGTRRATNRRLVDGDHFVEMLQAPSMLSNGAGSVWRAVQMTRSSEGTSVVDGVDLPEPETPVTQVKQANR